MHSLNNGFTRLIPPHKIRLSSMERHKWYPFISHLMQAVLKKTIRNDEYYIDLAFKEFGESSPFLKTFTESNINRPENSILPVIGEVGKGKTSFLEWWVKNNALGADSNVKQEDGLKTTERLFKDHYSLYSRININSSECDEWALDSRYVSWNIRNKIVSDLEPLFQYPKFVGHFKKKIQHLMNPYTNKIDNFEAKFVSQSEEFVKEHPRYGYVLLLTCLISAASDTFNKPIWIIFDNIDLESLKKQTYYIREAINIYQNTIDLAKKYNLGKVFFHIAITLRVETFSWHGYLDKYLCLNYPAAQMLAIAKRKFFKALDDETRHHFPDSKLTIGDITISSADELNEHIKRQINATTDFLRWSRYWKGGEENKWHNDLSNYNVRRFINFWCNFIVSGNFLEICGFSRHKNEQQPSVFKYMRKLFRGSYNEFSGNCNVDDSCKSKKSALVFNLFEPPIPYVANNKDRFIRHYLINIRILQRLYAYEERGVYYEHLKEDLSDFFDKEVIDSALRNLLWSRLINEVNEGIRNIATSDRSEIIFSQRTTLSASNTTKLYIDGLLNNFEYISTMSLVSWQIKNEFSDNFYGFPSELFRSSTATLAFLDSLRVILLRNFEEYTEEGTWNKFENLFFLPHHRSRPWMGGITNCIKALKQISRKYPEIKPTIEKFKSLRIYGKNQFSDFLDYDRFDLNVREL